MNKTKISLIVTAVMATLALFMFAIESWSLASGNPLAPTTYGALLITFGILTAIPFGMFVKFFKSDEDYLEKKHYVLAVLVNLFVIAMVIAGAIMIFAGTLTVDLSNPQDIIDKAKEIKTLSDASLAILPISILLAIPMGIVGTLSFTDLR